MLKGHGYAPYTSRKFSLKKLPQAHSKMVMVTQRTFYHCKCMGVNS